METKSDSETPVFSNLTYKSAIVFLLAGTALDTVTTFYGITNVSGVTEGNPIVRFGIDLFGPLAGILLLKAFLLVLSLLILTKIASYTKRDKYTMLSLGCGFSWGAAGMFNFLGLFVF